MYISHSTPSSSTLGEEKTNAVLLVLITCRNLATKQPSQFLQDQHLHLLTICHYFVPSPTSFKGCADPGDLDPARRRWGTLGRVLARLARQSPERNQLRRSLTAGPPRNARRRTVTAGGTITREDLAACWPRAERGGPAGGKHRLLTLASHGRNSNRDWMPPWGKV